ncbi:MAG: AraC family transcriptional regulator [Oculatellaceae cyanobacterium bins.114]|nr:AraC family transcriptional regulator [Oculatellaceae cyanobacterium bins.114]
MSTLDNLPQVDMAKHTHPALVARPILSSEQSRWNGIFFQHYDHPAHQSPDHQWTQHIIGITGRSGHPVESEHQIGGQFQNCFCKSGEMLLIPAGVQYASLWHEAGEFSLLGFSPKFFEQVAYESMRMKRIELLPHIGISDPLVQQIGLALKVDVEANHPAGRIFGESLATGLVIHLLRQYSAWHAQSEPAHKGQLSEHQLQKVFDYIQERLDQDVALSEIAGVLNLSQYHFCRLFKQSIGVAPHQYLTCCRIDRAKQLLLTTQQTITEIAFAVGFSNHSSFTRLFRRSVGMTPKEFRTLS